MTTDLFPDAIAIRPDMSKHGAQYQDGNWHIRNWNGYVQTREVGQRNWCFQIYGFRDFDCTVLIWHIDGTRRREYVPIDEANRITILGRKYGQCHWNH